MFISTQNDGFLIRYGLRWICCECQFLRHFWHFEVEMSEVNQTMMKVMELSYEEINSTERKNKSFCLSVAFFQVLRLEKSSL